MKYIALCLLFLMIGCSPYAANPFELAAIESISAYAVSIQENTTKKPVVECSCNGTKKVKSGDGLLVLDCPCGKDCVCKIKNNKDVIETRQLWLRTDPSWCKPCVKVAKELKKLTDKDKNWKISEKEDAHIRIMPPIDGENIPVLILMVDGKEVERWEGSEKIGDYKKIADHYYGR